MNSNHAVTGNGPDVVLIHGWGASLGVWREIAAMLAPRFRVHALDLPGHGVAPARPRGTLRDWAQGIAGNMPHRCLVVGWSLGALVAMAWAQLAPQQVRRMALVSATPSFVCRAGWTHGIEPAVLEGFARELSRDADRARRRFIALQVLGDRHARSVASALQREAAADDRFRAGALGAGLQILGETDLREALAGISQPTLVVHGERDRLIPPEAGRYVGVGIPGARFELVRGAAHAPFLSRPAEVSALLAAFLHG